MKRKSVVLIVMLAISLLTHAQNNDDDTIIYGKLSEGLRAFVKHKKTDFINQKMGFMDENNYVVLDAVLDYFPDYDIPYFKEGRCLFYERKIKTAEEDNNEFYGFLNKKFEKVIPANYPYYGGYCPNFPRFFSDGYAIVNNNIRSEIKNNQYILIDKFGKKIGKSFGYFCYLLAACEYFPEISEGLVATVNDADKKGYISASTGKTSIPFLYSLAGPFSEGLAAVEVNDEYIIFIDRTGVQKINKRFYTTKIGRRKSMEKNDPYTGGNGSNHLGGFINGKMIINYYENHGRGPMVYALIDKKGNVLLKKKVANRQEINQIDDHKFDDYRWKFGRD